MPFYRVNYVGTEYGYFTKYCYVSRVRLHYVCMDTLEGIRPDKDYTELVGYGLGSLRDADYIYVNIKCSTWCEARVDPYGVLTCGGDGTVHKFDKDLQVNYVSSVPWAPGDRLETDYVNSKVDYVSYDDIESMRIKSTDTSNIRITPEQEEVVKRLLGGSFNG